MGSKPKKKGMTVTAYAKHRGVSRQAVYKAIKQGRIVQEDDGSIDQPKADRMWRENTGVAAGQTTNAAPAPARGEETGPRSSPSAPPRALPPGELMTIAESEQQRRHYIAEQERLKYEEAEGSLVRLDDAMRMWATIAATIRTKVLGVPVAVGLASELLACETEHQVRMLLEDKLRAALVDLVEDYRGADAEEEDPA